MGACCSAPPDTVESATTVKGKGGAGKGVSSNNKGVATPAKGAKGKGGKKETSDEFEGVVTSPVKGGAKKGGAKKTSTTAAAGNSGSKGSTTAAGGTGKGNSKQKRSSDVSGVGGGVDGSGGINKEGKDVTSLVAHDVANNTNGTNSAATTPSAGSPGTSSMTVPLITAVEGPVTVPPPTSHCDDSFMSIDSEKSEKSSQKGVTRQPPPPSPREAPPGRGFDTGKDLFAKDGGGAGGGDDDVSSSKKGGTGKKGTGGMNTSVQAFGVEAFLMSDDTSSERGSQRSSKKHNNASSHQQPASQQNLVHDRLRAGVDYDVMNDTKLTSLRDWVDGVASWMHRQTPQDPQLIA
eukprot:PhF_6_TR8531/c1_g1_i2/m.13369